MSAPDSLFSLATDLQALPARDRRAILSSLSVSERAQASVLLHGGEPPTTLSVQPLRADFSHFSPWLAVRLEEARSAADAIGGGRIMTPATRQALVQVSQNGCSSGSDDAVAASAQRRSLLNVISGFLSSGREQ